MLVYIHAYGFMLINARNLVNMALNELLAIFWRIIRLGLIQVRRESMQNVFRIALMVLDSSVNKLYNLYIMISTVHGQYIRFVNQF